MTQAMPPSLRIELLTSPDIGRAIQSGMTTAVVPCGAIEQHGPHLPLCMDSDHADRLGLLVAARLGHALIAPTIRVGCSSHHMGFAGTVSLRPETFEALCRDYCESLAAHGFTRILLFSAHVGNCPVLADILPRLQQAVPDTCEVNAFTDSTAWLKTWKAAVEAAGGPGANVGGHADIAETSLMLVLRQESVQMQRAEPGHPGLLSEAERKLMWRDGIGGISANGILGDPRGASAAIGERCLDDMADLLVGFFE